MIASISHKGEQFRVDLNQPIDISLTLNNTDKNVTAWYVSPPTIEPVAGDGFIGAVKEGGSVNFRNIFFNPHGHGTHTECVGHISPEIHSIQDHINNFHFTALVVSIPPKEIDGDRVITADQLAPILEKNQVEALVIRTLPNTEDKLTQQYSNTNPAYLAEACAHLIADHPILHLLIDTPSVDREEDEGKLLSHRAFWKYPHHTRFNASITELIYVPNTVEDGKYLLNLQFASFDNDASPSKPVLYKILTD